MALVQLIYVSTADHELSVQELEEVHCDSVSHNKPQGITGMLLYSRGTFIQVLEGEESVVDETYKRICRDSRHHDIYLLTKEPISKREFTSWHMGFRHMTEQDAINYPHYAPMFQYGFDAKKIGAVDGLALSMLRQFVER